MLRVMPHVTHSVLPKPLDPVVAENYRRTGVVTPDQVNDEFFAMWLNDPEGNFSNSNYSTLNQV